MKRGSVIALLAVSSILFAIWLTSHRWNNRLADAHPPTSPLGDGESVTPSALLADPQSTSKKNSVETTRATVSAFNAAFATPIAFFGRVIDQHGDAVANAEIKSFAEDSPVKNGSQYLRKSDVDGNFFIDHARGISLAVQVSKAGYLVIPPSDSKVTSSGVFRYAVGTRRHVPDPHAPVIFHLYKLGNLISLIKVGERNFRIARDGTPLSISLDQRNGHQVILRCWNDDLNRPQGQFKYDWRLELSVSKGGLLARNDNFAFEAPEVGYEPTDTINMPASLP